MNDAEKTALESAIDQAMDTFVYAPIGLLFDGPELFTKLAERGRNQVHAARMIGEMAVQIAQRKGEKRLARTEGPLREALVAMGMAPPATKTAAGNTAPTTTEPGPAPGKAATKATAKTTKKAAKKAAQQASARKAPAKAAETAPATEAAPAPTSPALGIPDYDSLSASQVVKRLQGMGEGELDAIRAYEAATRARKTILNRITQLRKG